MVNSKKVIAGLGVVAGLGVAMLPLTSYADDPSSTTTGNVVRVGVADTLTVSVVENYATSGRGGAGTTEDPYYISVEQNDSNTSTLVHTVTVDGTTYADYALTMYSTTDGAKLIHTQTSDAYFSPLSADSESLSAGTWGFQIKDNQAATPALDGIWHKVGTADAQTTIHAAGTTTADKHTSHYTETYDIQYGVKAAENQLAGLYEGTVVYAATAAASL